MPDMPDDGWHGPPYTYYFDLSPHASLARRIWVLILVGLMHVGLGFAVVPAVSEMSGAPSEEGVPLP